uniref:Uncharacterized protein n=1 Tax=Trichuris muris TaxID=70415 RepID=A0A5S6R2G9_TRIMR
MQSGTTFSKENYLADWLCVPEVAMNSRVHVRACPHAQIMRGKKANKAGGPNGAVQAPRPPCSDTRLSDTAAAVVDLAGRLVNAVVVAKAMSKKRHNSS